MHRDARKAIHEILDGITNIKDARLLSPAQAAVDAIVNPINALDLEKDTRTAEGSRRPRDNKDSTSMRAKRPNFDVGNTADEQAKTSISFRSDQSFRSWAQANSDTPEAIRGINAGQFLRAMVV